MRIYLTLLLASVTALAQAPQQQTPKPGRVEGRVLDNAGQPLRGATITFRSSGPAAASIEDAIANAIATAGTPPAARPTPRNYSAQSGDDGSFAIDAVEPGSYQVQATRQGYLTQTYGAPTPENTRGIPVAVRSGEPLTGLSITLAKQGVIAGRVLDGSEGLQGADVRAVRFTYANGERRMQTPSAAISDDTGAFRITNLAPGRYYVYAELKPPGSSPIGGGLTDLLRATERPVQPTAIFPTYYPSSTTRAAATLVEITAGGEARADIRMRREPVQTVTGTVTGLTGSPARAMVLVMSPEDPPPAPPTVRIGAMQIPFVAATNTDAQGRFELRDVPAGQHTIVALGGTQIRMRLGGGIGTLGTGSGGPTSDDGSMVTSTLSVGNTPVEGVRLTLQAPGKIQGKLIVEGGEVQDLSPRRAAAPLVLNGNTNVPPEVQARINAVPAPQLLSSARISTNDSGQNVADAEGNFTIQNVAPGTYKLQMSPAPGFYIKSVRFGGADSTRSELNFTGGSAELQIVMAKGQSSLKGAVTNDKGEPAPGSMIALWPRTRDDLLSTGGIRIATADANGAFQHSAVAPGDYLAAAFAPLPDGGITQYRPFLELFTGEAISLKVEPNAAATANLKQIPADKAVRETAKLQ